MEKVLIQVEETLRYEDDIVVIRPEGMTEDEFEFIIRKAETEAWRIEGGSKDLAGILEKLGLKVESQTYSFPESPRSVELEILDVNDLK